MPERWKLEDVNCPTVHFTRKSTPMTSEIKDYQIVNSVQVQRRTTISAIEMFVLREIYEPQQLSQILYSHTRKYFGHIQDEVVLENL